MWFLVVVLWLTIAPLLIYIGVASIPHGLFIWVGKLHPFCWSNLKCYSPEQFNYFVLFPMWSKIRHNIPDTGPWQWPPETWNGCFPGCSELQNLGITIFWGHLTPHEHQWDRCHLDLALPRLWLAHLSDDYSNMEARSKPWFQGCLPIWAFFCSSMPGGRSKRSGPGWKVEESCKKGVLIENWPKNLDHKKWLRWHRKAFWLWSSNLSKCRHKILKK